MTKPLVIAANTILGDEKAYGLFEIDEQSPGNRGFHRYQILQVLRDGVIAEFRTDLGLTDNFKGVNQIRIPSFFEHTVDELKDMADYLRGEPRIDVLDLLELNTYKPG